PSSPSSSPFFPGANPPVQFTLNIRFNDSTLSTFMPNTNRTKADIIAQLTNPGVIAIIRARKTTQTLPIAEALLAGGAIAIEITMSTPNAIAAIRSVSEKLGSRALIGVGTVLDAATCQAAIAAGAEFVISPICRPELAQI